MGQLQDWGTNTVGPKNKFGLLSIFINQVNTQAGASYSMPGIIGKDGKPYEFKGKVLNPQGERLHVILVLEAHNAQGETYQAVRDDLSFSTAMQIARASLMDVMGEHWVEAFDNGARVPVQVEEAPTGDKTNTGKDKTTFKLVKRFESVDAMHLAEAEYFKAFRPSAPNGAAVNGIPVEILANASALWSALGGNEPMFRTFAAQDARLSSVPLETLVTAVVSAQPA